MKVIQIKVGAIATNCYIGYDEDTRQGAVIDPGDNAEAILAAAKKEEIDVKYILLTHAHFDHMLATAEVKKATNAQVVLHEADLPYLKKASMEEFHPFLKNYAEPQIDIVAKEGTELSIGNLTAVYLHTPGHTPGSSTIRMGDCLFTGDTLFCHECGRCDLPGGDFREMLRSLKRLSELPGDFRVLPGHDALSTLDNERRSNPYVLQAVVQAQ